MCSVAHSKRDESNVDFVVCKSVVEVMSRSGPIINGTATTLSSRTNRQVLLNGEDSETYAATPNARMGILCKLLVLHLVGRVDFG